LPLDEPAGTNGAAETPATEPEPAGEAS
jgi:hypothetical protein